MDNILEIKNLNVGFDIEINQEVNFYYALNDINLEFERGKIHAIAGESGCGKSVLINTILNLLPKNAKIKNGQIIFDGKILNKNNYKDIRGKKISLIPQDPFMSLNPLYTIENQLREVCDVNLIKNPQERIFKALEQVKIKNIENVLKSYPHELSGGMKQRIIIAMSLISNSDLILADEPTTALDVSVSNSILNLLVDLKNLGKTIILITHDLSIVYNYCDSATIMYLGNIVEKTNSKELFKHPMHPYTKALLKSLPNQEGKKLASIKGVISPISEIINGCKFNPRCDFCFEKCKQEKPILKKIENSFVSCHLY